MEHGYKEPYNALYFLGLLVALLLPTLPASLTVLDILGR
ncbi:membrane protein [Photobacterium swingsii]|nr:membrane protein [Photobacterium swingsii]